VLRQQVYQLVAPFVPDKSSNIFQRQVTLRSKGDGGKRKKTYKKNSLLRRMNSMQFTMMAIKFDTPTVIRTNLMVSTAPHNRSRYRNDKAKANVDISIYDIHEISRTRWLKKKAGRTNFNYIGFNKGGGNNCPWIPRAQTRDKNKVWRICKCRIGSLKEIIECGACPENADERACGKGD
jgi:hypothetical protein